jgi:hypothetical protein
LLDEPPDSSSRSVVTRADIPKALKPENGETAWESAADPAPAPPTNAHGMAAAAPSVADISVDLASFASEAEGERTPKAATSAGVSVGVSADVSQSSQPLLKRRSVFFGAVGACVTFVVLLAVMGTRPAAPKRHSSALPPSAKQLEARTPPAVSIAPAPVAMHEGPQTAPEAVASASEASASVTAATEAETVSDDVKIAIKIRPDGASLYYKGKVVGRTPFILKQPRGEKRSYEVGKPGYSTRRLTITGNERSIGFDLGIDTPHPDNL